MILILPAFTSCQVGLVLILPDTTSKRVRLEKMNIRPHKKNSWLASPPAHKKSPAQDFFIDQVALIYVVLLLTVVNCVNKLRNCVRK